MNLALFELKQLFKQPLPKPGGKTMGKKPSSMSIKAKAPTGGFPVTTYFLAGVAPDELRMPLKNSELAGSSTITSPLLLKLAL